MCCDGWPSAEVHYVATSAAPVTTDPGIHVRPATTTGELRDPDVVVVPGTGRPDLMLTDPDGPTAALIDLTS
jgi:hypothetical protein